MSQKRSIETTCIQGGWQPKNGEPRILPIYQSTTFKYSTSEQMGRLFDLEENGYFYTRLANPTNDAVADKIREMEGGAAAMLTSSGQAANFYAVFNICNAGDHFICSSTVYGGTSNLFVVTMKKMLRRMRLRKNSVRIRNAYSVNHLPTRPWWCWTLRSLQPSHINMEFLLS